jgi:hypothetical protein
MYLKFFKIDIFTPMSSKKIKNASQPILEDKKTSRNHHHPHHLEPPGKKMVSRRNTTELIKYIRFGKILILCGANLNISIY